MSLHRYGTVIGVGRRVVASMALVAATASTGACGAGDGDGASGSRDPGVPTELVLVAASLTEPGFDAVIEGFGGSEAGADLAVTAAYGASGDQSRKVAAGLPADAVAFAARPGMERVVRAGVVDPTWDADATHGVPAGSVVVLVVRDGDSLGIDGWDDLLRPGVDAVVPDPRTSGAGMWSLLASYAAAGAADGDPEAGLGFVRALVAGHVADSPASAGAASDAFLDGTGDVLITVESEAKRLAGEGAPVHYTVPDATMRVAYPFAVSARSGHSGAARTFMNYLYSTEGQRLWARSGFRPVDPGVAAEFVGEFPRSVGLHTIEDLGGWETVEEELFDGDDGAITRIFDEAGE
ncbi:extracellular solute-binding protein [Tomitella cavernea]|uniref:extracellular solute-binding protein n=1 Tax=Tomitella cavernea TaxID=1387982 RepID=UPI001905B6C5|nr:extracellular solute-binding protein [Tomitella cavernea]